MKKNLLWVGDAGVPSGFARATHEILNVLYPDYNVTVLGMNYRGDPHEYPYKLYAAFAGGDFFGVGRLIWMCDLVKPDVIVIQNDGWNFPFYIEQLQSAKEYKNVPVVAIVAVDGKNFRGEWLDGVSYAIFWTQFALDEARDGGFKGPARVIPLGVDLTTFYPVDKREARTNRRLDPLLEAFIVGNVNRNQPRKRWDLTLRYFAEWLKTSKPENAWLYLHTAPTGDTGIDVVRLAKYYGIIENLALAEPPTWYGSPDAAMRDTYCSFDVNITTTQGEGMGLTQLEAAACGVPIIAPDWSALGEVFNGLAAHLITCTTIAVGPPYTTNVIGGVADEDEFIRALDDIYCDHDMRKQYGAAALRRASESRFRWANIGARVGEVIASVLGLPDDRKQGGIHLVEGGQTYDKVEETQEAAWNDLGRP